MKRLRTWLLGLFAGVALAGCLGAPGDLDEPAPRPPREIARDVEALAHRGRLSEAYALLEHELSLRPTDAPPSALLLFTDAWLLQLRALAGSDVERGPGLEQAVDGYRAALALRPGAPEVSKNLTLALRELGRFEEALAVARALGGEPAQRGRAALLEGLLLADGRNPARDPELALVRLRAAGRSVEEDGGVETGAALQVVALFEELLSQAPRGGEGRVTLVRGLHEVACDYAARGLGDAAVRGLELVMADCGPLAEEALEVWVRAEAERGGLTLERLAALPACEVVTAAAQELAGLIETPAEATELSLPFWRATPERLDVATRTLRAFAAAHVLAEEPALAAPLLRAAARLGASGDPDLWLDVSLDLAVLLHSHRRLLDPERTELVALVDAEPLGSLDERHPERAAELLRRRGPEETAEIHAVLGAVHASLGRWRGRAQYHLDAAIALEEASAERARQAARLAGGLAGNTNPVELYLAAARDHLARGDRAAAVALRTRARAYARETGARAEELEELLYPTRGWYLAASYGRTDGHDSGAELQGDLLRRGHTTAVSLDDTRGGARLALGYRFAAPLALELGYTSLEGPASTITEQTNPPMPAQLVRDVVSLHPIAGKGPTLSVLWFPVERGRYSLYLEGGIWRWDSVVDVDLVVGGRRVRIDESSTDLFFGAGGEARLLGRLRARAALQRYLLDGDEVDLVSLGLVLGL